MYCELLPDTFEPNSVSIDPRDCTPRSATPTIQQPRSLQGAVAALPPAIGQAGASYNECRAIVDNGIVSAAELARWTALNCRQYQ
jgi:hypothetical protein